jgi:hypothetical protein
VGEIVLVFRCEVLNRGDQSLMKGMKATRQLSSERSCSCRVEGRTYNPITIGYDQTIMVMVMQLWLWLASSATINATVATGVKTVCNQDLVATGPGNFRQVWQDSRSLAACPGVSSVETVGEWDLDRNTCGLNAHVSPFFFSEGAT